MTGMPSWSISPCITAGASVLALVSIAAAMTAGHFIFIPSVLLIGVVVGWLLGSRAARDAYANELKRREERAARKSASNG